MMRKIAFVFPGQGAQKVGMGREMAERFPEVREVFDKADRTLGFSLSNLCWEGPEEELRKTVNTQPAILTTSVACLRMLEREQIAPIMVAGHSVGEYAALVAAGVLTFEEALKLVRRRGELMQEAGNTAPGTMAAVIGMEYQVIREACAQAEMTGVVEVANFNTPDQIVISGGVRCGSESHRNSERKGRAQNCSAQCECCLSFKPDEECCRTACG